MMKLDCNKDKTWANYSVTFIVIYQAIHYKSDQECTLLDWPKIWVKNVWIQPQFYVRGNPDSLTLNLQFFLCFTFNSYSDIRYLYFNPSCRRYLCHGWHGPPVCERLWFSRAQCCWAWSCPEQHQAEALGLSQGWWSHRQRVQHRPRCSSKNLFFLLFWFCRIKPSWQIGAA